MKNTIFLPKAISLSLICIVFLTHCTKDKTEGLLVDPRNEVVGDYSGTMHLTGFSYSEMNGEQHLDTTYQATFTVSKVGDDFIEITPEISWFEHPFVYSADQQTYRLSQSYSNVTYTFAPDQEKLQLGVLLTGSAAPSGGYQHWNRFEFDGSKE